MILMTILYMPLGSLFPLMVQLFYGEAWHNSIVEFIFAGDYSFIFWLLVCGEA